MTIRVFLVDDHVVVREGLRKVLAEAKDELEVAGEAATWSEAAELIPEAQPDVAIVDVRLPDGSGVELVRRIRSEAPQVKCIMFTSFADEDAFFLSVLAGASGYLMKDVGEEDLRKAVRLVAGGESLIRREQIEELRRRGRELPTDDRLLRDLTAQERRILNSMSRGMTNREIAEQLSLAEKTVRNYVSNILGKLGMKNRTQVAAYVARSIAQSRGRQ